MKLSLAEDLSLPLEAITQTFGILAVRGAGKSNAAAVMAEEMFAAKLPFVVVDPVGSWWGLRSAADGKSAGLAVPIFGGRHGDVPLEKTGGALLADLVVEHRLSCVLDVSELSEGDKTRFLIDFAERLYRRNQDPLHLFLEEADDYAPQRPFREQARLLRAWENIVRRGRARGLGITMITQRSAALNKNVLTQIETLLVLRTTSPQDRKAIAAWVEYHGQAKELLESLPGLDAGEAWIWSPSWLRCTKQVRIRRRWTFDSGATPKDLKGSRAPASLADVDLGNIRTRMTETIERAKAEDPKELRRQLGERDRRIRELERGGTKAVPVEKVVQRRIEVPILKDGHVARLETFGKQLSLAGDRLVSVVTDLRGFGQELVAALRTARNGSRAPAPQARMHTVPRSVIPGPQTSARPAVPKAPAHPRIAGDSTVSGSQQRILNALAWAESLGLSPVDKTQLALLADQRPTSGGYFNNLGALRSAGRLTYPNPGTVDLTEEGRVLAQAGDVPTTSEELQEQLYRRLADPQVRILRALIDVYPGDMTKDELAEQSHQRPTSGGYFNNLGRLRSLGLIEYPQPGRVVACPVLFLDRVRR